jgi:hypothetical protein
VPIVADEEKKKEKKDRPAQLNRLKSREERSRVAAQRVNKQINQESVCLRNSRGSSYYMA